MSINFKNHAIVYFVGPPEDIEAPLIGDITKHKLYRRRGRITIGISEDIRCYPDDPQDNMYWVRFEDDTVDLRQVEGGWLLNEEDFFKKHF